MNHSSSDLLPITLIIDTFKIYRLYRHPKFSNSNDSIEKYIYFHNFLKLEDQINQLI